MKEHEATCRAGRSRLGDLVGQKNQLLVRRAACHLIQLPSPERRAREAAPSAEHGRQECMRRRGENHEAQAAGRVRLEARTDVERAAAQVLELCGKQMVPPQEAERERAQAARTARRRAAAKECSKRAAAEPPICPSADAHAGRPACSAPAPLRRPGPAALPGLACARAASSSPVPPGPARSAPGSIPPRPCCPRPGPAPTAPPKLRHTPAPPSPRRPGPGLASTAPPRLRLHAAAPPAPARPRPRRPGSATPWPDPARAARLGPGRARSVHELQ
nr:uncharacterized protein LOC127328474 [Lolium perenne]